ncbi:hypothetical protein COLO4_20263 [Corchorus olitorius]|uniref:Hyaluronan/mRNA-binding protein domain-containing protein n=1 Tax=Corchorus olitorius TaxID=93759 RepID=A0A1R3J0T3_9ROSI|nr:hypothetical protein COLO4_20263 [Corchorus olitorius]
MADQEGNSALLDGQNKNEVKPKPMPKAKIQDMGAKPVKVANLFALLDDQEADDISKIVEGLKLEAPSVPKRKKKVEAANNNNNNNGEIAKAEGNNHPNNNNNGYYGHDGRRGYRSGNGYYRNTTNNGVGADCDQRDGGYRGSGRRFNGNAKEGEGDAVEFSQGQEGQRGRGGGGGGGGRGRGKYYNNNIDAGEGVAVEFSQGQEGQRGRGRGGGGGGRGRGKYYNNNGAVVAKDKEGEEAVSTNGDGDKKERDPLEEEMRRKKREEDEMRWKKKKEEWEANAKLKTLKDYQASLLENRKPLEALKKGAEVRRVSADEEFGCMQIIGKKKEKKEQDKKKFEEKKDEEQDKKKIEETKKHANSTKTITIDWTKAYYQQRRNFGRPFNGGGDAHDGGDDCGKPKPAAEEEKKAKGYDGRIEDLNQFPSLGTA